ncbi:MAG TPA: HDIG domain-containing protein [Elusimicrobiales bacterium]|nr:HDIG domain-containing protein [Elusimicrobiales bacterium]
MMNREQTLELLRRHVKNENMVRHCLAAEAVMRALAARFGEDAEKWGLAGLIHDVDVELTAGDAARHTLEAEKILRDHGCAPEIVEAVMMHNEAASLKKREDRFHKALAAGETITGLITATALVYPDRKLDGVKASSVLKRMKDKRFAASVDRKVILECEQIGVPLPEFVDLALTAMRGISEQLGM